MSVSGEGVVEEGKNNLIKKLERIVDTDKYDFTSKLDYEGNKYRYGI